MSRFLASAQNILNGRTAAAWNILTGKGGIQEAEGGIDEAIGVFTWDAEEDNYDIPALPHTATFTWDAEEDEYDIPALPHVGTFTWNQYEDTVL